LGLVFVDRGVSKLEKILWLVGEGANGKGVVFETIMGVLGRENCTNIDLAELTSGSNRDKNIARINGKLLNYCSEVSRKSIASDFAKALISGEPLPARELYGMPFTAYNIPLMMANTNKMPKTSDNTYAYFRRMIIMPFNVTIPEDMQDKNLAYKLKDEYSGILNWILAGRKRIVSNNFRFTKSSLVEQRLTDYIYEDGSITHFLRDSGYARKKDDITDRGIAITATELYGEYVRWCEKKGVDDDVRISSVKKLAILMGELKYKKERGGNGVRIRLYGRYHNRF
jgi:P4 family phage/plasmid primase-like protien